jgi:tRNA nucleotidyltransferase (CCA-adding enzyme)
VLLDPALELLGVSREGVLELWHGEALESLQRLRKPLVGDRRLGGQLLGEWIIGRHETDSTALLARVRAHPLIEAALPCLDDRVSLVGGAVRDALLQGALQADLDLVIEGDAVAVAGCIAERVGSPAREHPRFGTATVDVEPFGHLDLVTARTERYPEPGALPEVEPGTLDDDLRRRDFTINALALRLTGPSAGELVDPVGGRDDLRLGVIRVLHDASFEDDPSRVVRAARYVARLGFRLDPRTEAAAARAAPGLDWANSRNAEELRRVLEERDPEPALDLLRRLGAPGLRAAVLPRPAEALDAVIDHDGVPDLPRWPLLLGVLANERLLARVALPGWACRLAGDAHDGDRLARALNATDRRSEADRLLRDARPAAGVVAAALDARWARDWWARDRELPLEIDGNDLIAAGIARGPEVGRALERARAAMLDGRAPTRERQLAEALGPAT